MAKEIIISCDDPSDELRIDKFLALNCPELSRSYIQKLIADGLVCVNDKPVKPSFKLAEGDIAKLTVPDTVIPDILAEDIPLDIVYEDDDLIIVNKPKDMVVHPAAGNFSGTLVNALMFHCKGQLSGINGVERPGIVHRIDKDTTGLLVVCKNDSAHRLVAEQLKEHLITRRYRAICCGILKDDEGTVDAPIGRNPLDRKKMAINRSNGKRAVTHYRVLERLRGYTYIECALETGRTHQIRVHMSSLGHPLLGDEVYGGVRPNITTNGQCLHAGILGLVHPTTGEYMEWEAPLPDYFTKLLNVLK